MAHIICTVTNDLSQDQRMDRICTSLSSAGHEVWLVGRQKKDSLPLPDRPYQQIRLQCSRQMGKAFYLEYNLRLLAFLFWNRCDIINAVDLDTLLPCSIIKKWRKTPIIYDAHEYFSQTPEVMRRPEVQKVWEQLALNLIPTVNHCYTVGPQLAKIMGEVYGVHFDVVRNLPMRLPSFTPYNKESGKKIILYQGMLNEGRGLGTAIEAMQYLNGFELWLVGNGDIRKALEKKVKALNIEECVLFHGFIPPDRLKDFTQQAWIGLNLLENNGLSYYYSLANKAFDYIQYGVPSIQMAFPEYQSLQHKYDVFELLKELDARVLADKIKQLAAHTKRYRQLQVNCSIAAKELNWEMEEEKLLAIYDFNVLRT